MSERRFLQLFMPVWPLIDAIIFWTMDINKFNEKYNKKQMPVVNIADELTKLNDLKEKGILSE